MPMLSNQSQMPLYSNQYTNAYTGNIVGNNSPTKKMKNNSFTVAQQKKQNRANASTVDDNGAEAIYSKEDKVNNSTNINYAYLKELLNENIGSFIMYITSQKGSYNVQKCISKMSHREITEFIEI